MELTFLKIIQRALSAIDSQSVTSAGDSPEAEQVGIIVNRVYEEILTHRDWPFLRKKGTSLVTNTPSVAWELELPSDLLHLEYIRYNKKTLRYQSPEAFQELLDSRDTTSSIVNSSGILTDRDPQYWTTFDEESIVFDAYDSDNATLLPSLCYVQYMREVTSELSADSDVPELPVQFHHVLMDGVLHLAFSELAQDTGKADRYETKFRRGMSRMNVWARKVDPARPNYLNNFNYGRKKRKWTRTLQFPKIP